MLGGTEFEVRHVSRAGLGVGLYNLYLLVKLVTWRTMVFNLAGYSLTSFSVYIPLFTINIFPAKCSSVDLNLCCIRMRSSRVKYCVLFVTPRIYVSRKFTLKKNKKKCYENCCEFSTRFFFI